MFPKILEKLMPKTDIEPDEDAVAESEAAPTALVAAVEDQDPSGEIDRDVLETVSETASKEDAGTKERRHVETMYPEDWGTKFECMGELVVERRADASDVVKVYQTLNEGLKAEIFYLNPTHRGTSIVCGITDAAMFMASLPLMPKVSTWALTHK